MSNDLDKMSNRVSDLVETLSGLVQRIETQFHEVTQQSRNMQKEMNKLHESVVDTQKQLKDIQAGQDFVRTAIEKGNFSLGASHTPDTTQQAQQLPPSGATQEANSGDTSKLKMSEFLKQKQSVFDTRVLNAFINATKETTKMLLMKEAKFVRPQPLLPSKSVTFSNAARMKLSKGKDSGFMGAAFKDRQLQPTVAALFGIAESDVTIAMINDLVKEFCNQVFGQAKSALQKDGISYTITYPEIALGSQLEIRKAWGESYLALIFELNGKEFYILFW